MLVLPAVLTHADASACLRMLAQGLRSEAGDTVVADAAALQHFDSSALAVLLECRREALASGKRFAVRGMPARLGELAGVYGVSELLPVAG
ncbi:MULTISPECIES: STAS domain-containing protein [Ramlibacter]|uniref:STAS domain-containing protein n=1 Tax=Ramlibacter aquaticus TaxID=2780094 RepID=A0ABR9SCC8_9BURK|nr:MULTISPECIES: STAS domain-containing protein [Ramlibacter]MBE7940003.1 STAS domain-containing protein [Ramlibacter aquaticus]